MPLVPFAKAHPLPDPKAALYEVAVRHVPGFAAAARAALTRVDVPALIRASAMVWAEHSVRVMGAGARSLPPEPAAVEAVLAAAISPVQDDYLGVAYEKVLLDGARTGFGQVSKRRTVPRVAVNPASVEWARERGSKLVRDVSARQRELIRRVVARGLERGQRADTMARAIRRAVGLLEREELAVERRRELLLAQGADEARADTLADQYAGQLLEARALRIARTETVAAQNRGLLDGWLEAQEAGELPADIKREWVAAPESPNPNRPCQICLALDGQRVGLDEPFVSEEVGEIMTAPAHVACRCTAVLRRGGSDE